MKIEFIKELEKIALKDKKIFFLTGDLGFNAFESIRDHLGERFINAGIAEQNMISVAAGLASTGLKPWVYSISTFLTLKTVEQVRNDVCHLNLSVKLIGFGGGYGFGIMGESHHLLEDLAIYSSLPNMKIYIPAFSEDMPGIIGKMYKSETPSYLRLNLVPKTTVKLPKYSSLRLIERGNKITIIVLGPLVHNVLSALLKLDNKKLADVFCVSEMPFDFSQELIRSIKKNKKVLIIEEHAESGGLGEKIFSFLGKNNIANQSSIHLYAKGYPSGLYGDHFFHQAESELDSEGILRNIKKILKVNQN